ncbi:hypothetical protein HN51_047121 [Arachis hypogaea]
MRVFPYFSLFLFDLTVLRYFRKDGHNWRKKKNGKTVKEAHEKLKVGSVDVLHCYYAHGEKNEKFQRRSYWMLEMTSFSPILDSASQPSMACFVLCWFTNEEGFTSL